MNAVDGKDYINTRIIGEDVNTHVTTTADGAKERLDVNAITTSSSMAVKITEAGSITYVAKAPTGSAQASAVWQALKIDETTGMVITWADGNANFDNVATNLAALSYS